MDRKELVRQALLELGDSPSQDLSSFIEKKHGVKIEPKFIPLFKASIRDLDSKQAFYQESELSGKGKKIEIPRRCCGV